MGYAGSRTPATGQSANAGASHAQQPRWPASGGATGAQGPTPQPNNGAVARPNGLPFGPRAPAICHPAAAQPCVLPGWSLRRRNGRREPPASGAIADTPPETDERASWISSHLTLLPGAGSPARERRMAPSTSRRCKRRFSVTTPSPHGDKRRSANLRAALTRGERRLRAAATATSFAASWSRPRHAGACATATPSGPRPWPSC
jgi:hypothetical protein